MGPKFKELENKVIIITGGGGVLGSTLAESLSQQGAKLAILDLNLDAAQAVADRIREKGGKAQGFEANVLNRESLQQARNNINELFGSCDILINGAGGNHPKGTTSKSFLLKEDLEGDKELITFFDLDYDSV